MSEARCLRTAIVWWWRLPRRRKNECRGALLILTTAPGAYGPPQHFEMYVYNAEGFAPLYTKVYLGDDPHLRTLGKDNVESLLRDRRVVVPQFSLKPTAAPTAIADLRHAAPRRSTGAHVDAHHRHGRREERLRLAERDVGRRRRPPDGAGVFKRFRGDLVRRPRD